VDRAGPHLGRTLEKLMHAFYAFLSSAFLWVSSIVGIAGCGFAFIISHHENRNFESDEFRQRLLMFIGIALVAAFASVIFSSLAGKPPEPNAIN
jgi:hypothetical protein